MRDQFAKDVNARAARRARASVRRSCRIGRALPRARALPSRDRDRHDHRRDGVSAGAHDHARGRAPRNRRRASTDRPARAPHPRSSSFSKACCSPASVPSSVWCWRSSRNRLINQFFQWRYDTALVFVRVTTTSPLTCVTIAVPLGVSATVVASWALLRRDGLRLARR